MTPKKSKELAQWSQAGDQVVLGGSLPYLLRMIMLGFLVWVVVLGACILVNFPRDAFDITFAFIFSLVFLWLVALPCAILFWVNRVTLDLTARSYVWERGVSPFVKRRQGSLDDFDHLAVVLKTRQSLGDMGGTYSYWDLLLVWKEQAQTHGKKKNSGASSAITVSGLHAPHLGAGWASLAEILSEKTGLPLRDEPRKAL